MKIEITLTSYQAGGEDATMIAKEFTPQDEEDGDIDTWVEVTQLENETAGFTEHYVDRVEFV